MQTVILLVGVPGSGKTWLLDHLPPNKFTIIRNDDYIGRGQDYLTDIITAAKEGNRTVICETPFSISMITVPLIDAGVSVSMIYLIEDEHILMLRWHERKTKQSAQDGHLSRQTTYLGRAMHANAPHGNSEEMLKIFNELIV